jgi:hypothetical protein
VGHLGIDATPAQVTLYLIGGPPRTGKTTLAKRILRERGIPWASTDAVRDTVSPVVPGLVEAGRLGEPPEPEADLLVPFIVRFALDMAYVAGGAYVVEGIGFLPRDVHRFERHGDDVRAVFVGFSDVTLASIDLHAPHSWQATATDDERTRLVPWILDSSERYRADAAAHRQPYVDLSPDFEAGHDAALERLFADREA